MRWPPRQQAGRTRPIAIDGAGEPIGPKESEHITHSHLAITLVLRSHGTYLSPHFEILNLCRPETQLSSNFALLLRGLIQPMWRSSCPQCLISSSPATAREDNPARRVVRGHAPEPARKAKATAFHCLAPDMGSIAGAVTSRRLPASCWLTCWASFSAPPVQTSRPPAGRPYGVVSCSQRLSAKPANLMSPRISVNASASPIGLECA